MTEAVSVYVNVRENGTLSISVDVPVDLIREIQKEKTGVDVDKVVEESANGWLGGEMQSVHRTVQADPGYEIEPMKPRDNEDEGILYDNLD